MEIQQEFARAPKMVAQPILGKKPKRFGGGWHNENNTLSQSRNSARMYNCNIVFWTNSAIDSKTAEKTKKKERFSYFRMTLVILLVARATLSSRRHDPTIVTLYSRIHIYTYATSPARAYITFANLRGDLRELKEMCDVALYPHNALLNAVGCLVSLRYVCLGSTCATVCECMHHMLRRGASAL